PQYSLTGLPDYKMKDLLQRYPQYVNFCAQNKEKIISFEDFAQRALAGEKFTCLPISEVKTKPQVAADEAQASGKPAEKSDLPKSMSGFKFKRSRAFYNKMYEEFRETGISLNKIVPSQAEFMKIIRVHEKQGKDAPPIAYHFELDKIHKYEFLFIRDHYEKEYAKSAAEVKQRRDIPILFKEA